MTFDICPRCKKVKDLIQLPKGEVPLFASSGEIDFTNTLCSSCKYELVVEKAVFVQEIEFVNKAGKRVSKYTGNWMELGYENFGAGSLLVVSVPESHQFPMETKVFKLFMREYEKSQKKGS